MEKEKQYCVSKICLPIVSEKKKRIKKIMLFLMCCITVLILVFALTFLRNNVKTEFNKLVILVRNIIVYIVSKEFPDLFG